MHWQQIPVAPESDLRQTCFPTLWP
jgi:hypothetical protein